MIVIKSGDAKQSCCKLEVLLQSFALQMVVAQLRCAIPCLTLQRFTKQGFVTTKLYLARRALFVKRSSRKAMMPVLKTKNKPVFS